MGSARQAAVSDSNTKDSDRVRPSPRDVNRCGGASRYGRPRYIGQRIPAALVKLARQTAARNVPDAAIAQAVRGLIKGCTITPWFVTAGFMTIITNDGIRGWLPRSICLTSAKPKRFAWTPPPARTTRWRIQEFLRQHGIVWAATVPTAGPGASSSGTASPTPVSGVLPESGGPA
jgi:hypothetical protein